jgi:hypothetical protein
MSVKDMRDELRALRKEHVKPVSKMGKADISAEIQRLKVAREETPAPAATKGKAAAKETEALGMVKDDPFAYVEGTKKGMPRKTARKAYEKKEDPPKEKFIQEVVSSPKFKKGAFKAEAKKHKMGTVEYAEEVLEHPEKHSEKTRKRAQFVENIAPKAKSAEAPKAPEAPKKKGKFAKGSKEAAEHMAKIRAMKGKKKE